MRFHEFWPLYLASHANRGTRVAHYLATCIGIAGAVLAISPLAPWWMFWVGIGIAYGVAFTSHWTIEGNNPVTWNSPRLTLLGMAADVRMCLTALAGGIGDELRRYGLAEAAGPLSPRHASLLRLFRNMAIACAIATLSVPGYLAFLNISENFHTVVAGEFYRSAQLTPEELLDYAGEYGMKTIVNLRGAHHGSAWYDNELAAARKLGIAHVDFDISAHHEMTQDQAVALLQVLETAQKPVLVHCESGADRSGLAAALYLAAIAKQGEEAAERQLSMRYGDIGLASTADRAWEKFETWLGFSDS